MSARFIWAAIALGSVTAGCLPLGDPPAGEHIFSGRRDIAATFQTGVPGAPTHLFVFRSAAEAAASSFDGSEGLYDVSTPDPATGQPRVRLLLEHSSGFSFNNGCDGCGLPVDARGRMYVSQQLPPAASGFPVFVVNRVDLETGALTELGAVTVTLSTDGTLALVSAADGSWTVRDLDDHVTPLAGAKLAVLVDRDVYFVSLDDQLMRLRGGDLGAKPEVMLPGVPYFFTLPTARGTLIAFAGAPAEMDGPFKQGLFDTVTSQRLPDLGEAETLQLPTIVPSPSGRYLLLTNISGEYGQAIYDRDTGALQRQRLGPMIPGGRPWRPGRDELWTTIAGLGNADGYQQSTVSVWRPGEDPVIVFDGSLYSLGNRYFDSAPFTPDGNYVMTYAWNGDPKAAPVIGLRSTDDPQATTFPVDRGGGVSGYWPLPDGRGLVENFTNYSLHADLSLADPATRTWTPLASGGWVVATGAHRALALLEWVKGSNSGALTAIDYDTGKTTVLAENVHQVAVDVSPTAGDRLAPGTRVAFLVRSRIPSPYDGAWLVTLP